MKCRFRHLQACLNASIKVAKEKYHSIVNKLINTQKNSKVYWSLLKVFLNNKKIPIIPPLSYENRFITDFKQKAKLFNFFSFSYSYSYSYFDVNYITDKHLSTVTAGEMIQNLY